MLERHSAQIHGLLWGVERSAREAEWPVASSGPSEAGCCWIGGSFFQFCQWTHEFYIPPFSDLAVAQIHFVLAGRLPSEWLLRLGVAKLCLLLEGGFFLGQAQDIGLVAKQLVQAKPRWSWGESSALKNNNTRGELRGEASKGLLATMVAKGRQDGDSFN